jgi:predicted RNase H-like HicB family nuclease
MRGSSNAGLDVSGREEYRTGKSEEKGEEDMKIEVTAIFQQVPEGFIGFAEEIPGANTQGATLEEARENLKEAVHLVLGANRALAEEAVAGKKVIKETLRISAA